MATEKKICSGYAVVPTKEEVQKMCEFVDKAFDPHNPDSVSPGSLMIRLRAYSKQVSDLKDTVEKLQKKNKELEEQLVLLRTENSLLKN